MEQIRLLEKMSHAELVELIKQERKQHEMALESIGAGGVSKYRITSSSAESDDKTNI